MYRFRSISGRFRYLAWSRHSLPQFFELYGSEYPRGATYRPAICAVAKSPAANKQTHRRITLLWGGMHRSAHPPRSASKNFEKNFQISSLGRRLAEGVDDEEGDARVLDGLHQLLPRHHQPHHSGFYLSINIFIGRFWEFTFSNN